MDPGSIMYLVWILDPQHWSVSSQKEEIIKCGKISDANFVVYCCSDNTKVWEEDVNLDVNLFKSIHISNINPVYKLGCFLKYFNIVINIL